MNLYPGTEHLLIPVACGDAFLDIRIACGDQILTAMMEMNEGNDGPPVWPFTFHVKHDPHCNIFAYSFPVNGQHVHVTEFGEMPERRRLVAALLASGATRVTYRTADELFDFYPEDFDEVMYGKAHKPRAPARRVA